MARNRMKKCLFISSMILVANLVCVPMFPAILSQNLSQNNQSGLYGETSVSSAGGKPDLIVSAIDIVPYMGYGSDCAAAEIRNIGDAGAYGYIYVTYRFIRMFFRTVPRIGTVWGWQDGGLQPGDIMTFFMIYEDELPKFGFFEFRCTVNPDFTIDESNYDNNDLSRKYVAFLGQWKAID